MPPTRFPSPVTAAVDDVGEGPVWDARRESLRWVDLEPGLMHELRDGEVLTSAAEYPVGFCLPRDRGGLLVGTPMGLFHWESGHARQVCALPSNDAAARVNDGDVDQRGRVLFGTVSPTRTGHLYRVDLDGTLTCLASGFVLSNGIGWSPDSRVLYHVDSGRHVVYASDYDLSDGSISRRRVWLRSPMSYGLPDGLAVDQQGGVWVAYWGGAAVRRYTRDGTLDLTLSLPVTQPTSVCLGGADGRTLYVTTARRGLTPSALDRQPWAGAVLAQPTDIPGLPTNRVAA